MNVRKHSSLVSGVALAALLVTIATAEVGTSRAENSPSFVDAPVLFSEVTQLDEGDFESEPVDGELRYVKVDIGALSDDIDGQVIRLNLFEELDVVAILERTEPTTRNGFLWFGSLPDYPNGDVRLSVLDGVVVGSVTLDLGESYLIRYAGQGVHVIRAANPDDFLIAADPILKEANDANADLVAPGVALGRRLAPALDDCGSIDVLVVYTAAARISENGVGAIEGLAFLALADMNLSLKNSGLVVRVRIVHITEVPLVATTGPKGSASVVYDRIKKDLKTLEANADVKALRNKYGADLVSLLTDNVYGIDTGQYYGGIANYLNLSGGKAEWAYSLVTAYSAAAPYYSFAHELAHNLGAQHDWYSGVDPSAVEVFNKGHIPSTRGGWRTVMAYANGCVTPCPVRPYYSNLGFYPDDGLQMGVDDKGPIDCKKDEWPAVQCQANVAAVIEALACKVADYRETSPGRDDVWIKDTWKDTGAEKNPDTAPMWKSPSIWVRRDADPDGLFQHLHENPEPDETNHIYAKLQNGGAASADGQLKFYWANANSGGTPWNPTADVDGNHGAWKLIGSPVSVTILPDSTMVVSTTWIPTDSGHICLIARWVSAADPMFVTEGTGIYANTQNNNNIAWRNVTVMTLLKGSVEPVATEFIVSNGSDSDAVMKLKFRVPPEELDDPFLDHGSVVIDLGADLLARWDAMGAMGSGFYRQVDGTLLITSTAEVEILGLPLDPLEEVEVGIAFQLYEETSNPFRAVYTYEVEQSIIIGGVPPLILGGLAFELRLESAADAPGRVVGAVWDDSNGALHVLGQAGGLAAWRIR